MRIKKIKTRLLLSYLVFVTMLLFLGTFSIFAVSQVNKNGQDIYNDRLVPVIELTNIVDNAGNIRLQMVQSLLRKDSSMTGQALTDLKEIDVFIKSYGENNLGEEEKKVFEDFQVDWEKFSQRVQNNASLMKAGDFENADEGIRLGGEEYKSAYAGLQKLIKINQNASEEIINNNNNKAYKNFETILIISIVIAIIIAIVISTTIGNMIANSIKLIVNRVSRIAEGDLTGEKISVKSRDEIAQLAEGINIMQNNLNTLVH